MKHGDITQDSRGFLTGVCKQLCEEFALGKVYFAQIQGKRRHYLAGYGEEEYKHTEHIALSTNVAFFWQGCLSESARQRLRATLAQLVASIEKELRRNTPNDDRMPSR